MCANWKWPGNYSLEGFSNLQIRLVTIIVDEIAKRNVRVRFLFSSAYSLFLALIYISQNCILFITWTRVWLSAYHKVSHSAPQCLPKISKKFVCTNYRSTISSAPSHLYIHIRYIFTHYQSYIKPTLSFSILIFPLCLNLLIIYILTV